MGIVLSMNRGAWQSDGDLTRTLLAVATYLYQSNISSVQFPYTKSLVKPWLNQPEFYSTEPLLQLCKHVSLQKENIFQLQLKIIIVFTSVIAQKVQKCLEYFDSLSPWFLVVLGHI